MFTFCPNCRTIFRLTPRHLSTAGGYTRCGKCRLVYSAIDYLYEDLPSTRAGLDRDRQAREDPAEAGAQEPLADNQAVSAGDDHAVPLLSEPAGWWHQGGLTLRDVSSGAAIVFLALLMATQWVFFNRADLAREPAWRPGLEQFCKLLYCSLPLQVDLSQLELLNREVRQHPWAEEALLVNATLSNKAEFTQPYPVLELSFSDLGGNPVAVRRFRPPEYVNDSDVIKRGMQPGEPVPVVLEIVDPGTEALSYQFGFL